MFYILIIVFLAYLDLLSHHRPLVLGEGGDVVTCQPQHPNPGEIGERMNFTVSLPKSKSWASRDWIPRIGAPLLQFSSNATHLYGHIRLSRDFPKNLTFTFQTIPSSSCTLGPFLVNFAPSVTFIPSETSFSLGFIEHISLRCIVDAFPLVQTVVWHCDPANYVEGCGSEQAKNNDIVLSLKNNSAFSSDTSVTVNCTATNSKGEEFVAMDIPILTSAADGTADLSTNDFLQLNLTSNCTHTFVNCSSSNRQQSLVNVVVVFQWNYCYQPNKNISYHS